MARIGLVPGGPARVVGGSQRLELQGRVHARGAWRVARETGVRENDSFGGQGAPVAAVAVGAGGVQAIRTTLHVWAGGRRPTRGEVGEGAVWVRAQPG